MNTENAPLDDSPSWVFLVYIPSKLLAQLVKNERAELTVKATDWREPKKTTSVLDLTKKVETLETVVEGESHSFTIE